MKTETEIRDFLATMAEHDKELAKQLREDIERQIPFDIPRPVISEHVPHVNCRCVVKPQAITNLKIDEVSLVPSPVYPVCGIRGTYERKEKL